MALDTYKVKDYELIQTRSSARELRVSLKTDPEYDNNFVYWIPEITDRDAVTQSGLFGIHVCQYCSNIITTKYTSNLARFDPIYCCQKCYGLIELMFECCTNPHPMLAKLSRVDYLPIAKRAGEFTRVQQELKQDMIQKTFMLSNTTCNTSGYPRELRIMIFGHLLKLVCNTYQISASSFC